MPHEEGTSRHLQRAADSLCVGSFIDDSIFIKRIEDPIPPINNSIRAPERVVIRRTPDNANQCCQLVRSSSARS